MSSINITINDTTATLTIPFPICESQRLIDPSTGIASLRGRKETINLLKPDSFPFGFILNLTDEFRPTIVRDGFGKAMIPEHSLYMEVLGKDRLVFAYQPMTEFVKKIGSLIGNLFVNMSYLDACLVSVFASLLLAGKTALSPLQFLFRFSKKFRRINPLSFGCHKEGFHPEVNSDLQTCSLCLDIQGNFTQNRGKILPRWIHGDGDMFCFPIRASVKSCFKRLDFRDGEKSGFGVNAKILRYCEALFLSFFLEGRKLKSISKEMGIGCVKMSKGLLERLGIGLIKPGKFRLLFQLSKHPGRIMVVKALLFFAFIHGVVVNTLSKKMIVDEATLTKLIDKNLLLFFGRVNAISECFIDRSVHILHLNISGCRSQEKSKERQAIHLPAKARSFLA